MDKERMLKDIDMLLGHLRYLISLEPLIQCQQMEKSKKDKKDESANDVT